MITAVVVLVHALVLVSALILFSLLSSSPSSSSSSSSSRSLLSFPSTDGVASQVDAHLPGILGDNIRIAILDSGLSSSQDALSHVIERLDFTSDGNADDRLGHGSFVAAVIAGSSSSCPGLAPDAHLHIYRVFTSDHTSYTAWFLDALNYALWADVHVLNLSVGGPDHVDAPFIDKIIELCSAGIVIVSAVGNDGPLYGTHLSPADLTCVIGVGGLNQDGSISSFSARGMTLSELHKHAMGRIKPDIVTLADRVQASFTKGTCRTLSGTSVASPIVAGAVALLLSSLPSTSPLRNPAAMKQALMETAVPLADISMFEQGAGQMQIQAAYSHLQSMPAHISAFPAAIDFTNCPYFGPYCDQPLFADAEPVVVNVTLQNSVAVDGRIESVSFTQDDDAVLDVRFSYPPLLWPWSGWLGVHIGVGADVDAERIARGTIQIVVRAGGGLHTVRIATACRVVPTPARSRRVLWDQYHNMQFPMAFAPRDNLHEMIDILDWHADHLYTNFHTFYREVRTAGFFIDILDRDLTCFVAERYAVLMIADPERPFQSAEIAKIRHDIAYRDLSLFVVADWFNRDELLQARFFDKNTQRWWEPVTGGANIPAINDLLRSFDIEFSSDIIDGTFRIGGRPVSVHSGSSLKHFPAGGHLLLTTSLSSSQRRSNIAIGGALPLGNSRVVVYGDSNGFDDAQSEMSTRADWLMILLLEFAASGVVPEKLAPGLTTASEAYDSGGTAPSHIDLTAEELSDGLCSRSWRIPIPFQSMNSQASVSVPALALIVALLVSFMLALYVLKRRQMYHHLRLVWLPISTNEDPILDRRK